MYVILHKPLLYPIIFFKIFFLLYNFQPTLSFPKREKEEEKFKLVKLGDVMFEGREGVELFSVLRKEKHSIACTLSLTKSNRIIETYLSSY